MFLYALLSFFLLPSISAQTTTNNATNVTNGTSVTCGVLAATVTINNVGWFKSGNSDTLKQLASTMISAGTLKCPVAQSQSNYIITSKSPGHVVTFNSREYCQIVSFGAAELCVFTPLAITAATVSNWGVSPVLDRPRGLIFFFTVERFSLQGVGQNGDTMIVDMIVSVSCGYVLMFSETNLNGRSVEAEGGRKAMVAELKCRVWLPHTSTVAGYTDPNQDGSSSGLYGLFALIVLPVLACAALIGYGCYSWLQVPQEIDVDAELTEQQQGKMYTPQTYLPQAQMPQAYFPQGYIPRI